MQASAISPPTRSESVVSNQAAGLKAQLSAAAEECLKTLQAKMLRM